MTSMFRWSARAAALCSVTLLAGCLMTPDGQLVGIGVPPPGTVVYNQGVPPPAMEVQVAPPPPQYEPVPMVPPGQTWAPGYWYRAGSNWAWRSGSFVAARPGYAYYPGTWVVRGGGRYGYVPGFYRPANRPAPRYGNRVYRPAPVRVQVYQR